jgi:hypothetical protein
MGIQSFLEQKFSHFSRSAKKKEVIGRILNSSDQQNNDVVNIHRYDPTNIGDFYCGPHHYFEELKGKQLDIFDYKRDDKAIRDNWFEKITQNSLIIGGGGLLNREGFDMQMELFEKLGEKGKKTVLWGPGHNSKNKSSYGKVTKYNIDTAKFGLVGVRDYGMKEEWVPCPSCLHPIFDTPFEARNEIGIIFHKKTLSDKNVLAKFRHFPSTSNDAVFEDVVQFIGETDTVLTDSYHAMYWSLMLGKKVMVFPNSSKFYDFKYQPVISSFSSFENDLKKVRSYSGVIEECREINMRFAEKTFDYLGL